MFCVKICPFVLSMEDGHRGVRGPVVREPADLEALNAVNANATCLLLRTVDGFVSVLIARWVSLFERKVALKFVSWSKTTAHHVQSIISFESPSC